MQSAAAREGRRGAGWLAGWLVGWLAVRLAGWLVYFSVWAAFLSVFGVDENLNFWVWVPGLGVGIGQVLVWGLGGDVDVWVRVLMSMSGCVY